MAFRVLTDSDDRNIQKLPISSLTITLGELIELVSGATTWTECTSTSNHFTRKAIALEAATTSDTTVLAYELTGNERVEATVTNTASASHNGDSMVLTNSNTVNNTGTNATTEYICFIQEKVGKDTSTIVGRVVVGNGVDPDATT